MGNGGRAGRSASRGRVRRPGPRGRRRGGGGGCRTGSDDAVDMDGAGDAVASGAVSSWSPTAAKARRRMNPGANFPAAEAARTFPDRSRSAAVTAMTRDMAHQTVTIRPAVFATRPSWSSNPRDSWRAEEDRQRCTMLLPVPARNNPSNNTTVAMAASARSTCRGVDPGVTAALMSVPASHRRDCNWLVFDAV